MNGRTWRFAMSLMVAAVLGACQSSRMSGDFKPTMARFHLEANDGEGKTVTLPQSGVTARINAQPIISEGDIIDVDLVQVDLGKCLMFKLTPSASRDFYRMSVTHNGRRLVLMLDQIALGARRIDGAITDGTIYVFVEMADEHLPALVSDLKRSAFAVQRELLRR
jgi:hypothetical protein